MWHRHLTILLLCFEIFLESRGCLLQIPRHRPRILGLGHISRDLNEPLPKRRARSLLQACGFLDIDYCREYRRPILRSWGQRPQVEERSAGDINKRLFIAVQCSQCRHCIRSLVYYKCVETCKDHSVLRNRIKLDRYTKPLPGDDDEENLNMSYTSLMDQLDEPAEYRICPGCLNSCTHSRHHLRAVRQFHLVKDPNRDKFSQELDAWEDINTGRSLLALGSATWEHFVENFQKSSSMLPATRTMFPAGDTHTALMFGPLLIENGVTRYVELHVTTHLRITRQIRICKDHFR